MELWYRCSPYRCRVQIRFHGGATREVTLPLPCGAARLGDVQPDVVELVERLAVERTPEAIAAELNRQGYTAWQGLPYTAAGVNGHSKFPHPRSSKIPPPLV